MSISIDVLCENTVGRPIPAHAEHGFSCLVQGDKGKWLFDTGRGGTILRNLSFLNLSLHDLDGIFLSHGHNDHCGGLEAVLKVTGSCPVYAHPQIFEQRYWKGLFEQRDISMPFDQESLERAGAKFHFLSKFTQIVPGLFYSGEIPRLCMFETGDSHLVKENADQNGLVPDVFFDDAAIGVETKKGIVIILGCAHAGLINTIDWFQKNLSERRIHAIAGGTHLGPAGDHQFEETVAYLKQLDFDRLGLSHCTGQIRAAQLYAQFPNKVFFANVGTSIEID